MREVKRIVTLEPDEYRILLRSLIHFRNALIAEGKYTDAVDEVLLKIINAKQKKFRVIYKEV